VASFHADASKQARAQQWTCAPAIDLDHRQNFLLGDYYKLELPCTDGSKDIYVSCDDEGCYIDLQ
jgi:hypothetical protein